MEKDQMVASVAGLKARLSHYLRRVQRGETVIVTDRGRPVATLSPAREVGLADRAQRLVEAGIARAPSGGLPADFWERRGPADPEGRTLAGMLEERRDGR